MVTEQMAAKSLPKTCLVLRNSEDEASVAAWEQFQQIFKDMKVGTDVVDSRVHPLFQIIMLMKRLLYY